MLLQAIKRKERYERAKDTSLLPIDRTVGNLLEWMPIFMGFFWTSMLLTGVKYKSSSMFSRCFFMLPICWSGCPSYQGFFGHL
jgi:hypothetical protein